MKSIIPLTLLLACCACSGEVDQGQLLMSNIDASCLPEQHFKAPAPKCMVLTGRFWISREDDAGTCELNYNTFSCLATQVDVFVQGDFDLHNVDPVDGLCNLCDGKVATHVEK